MEGNGNALPVLLQRLLVPQEERKALVKDLGHLEGEDDADAERRERLGDGKI